MVSAAIDDDNHVRSYSHDLGADNVGIVSRSQRALPLAVTIQVSRYCSKSLTPLAVQILLYKCGCASVFKHVLGTFVVHVRVFLVDTLSVLLQVRSGYWAPCAD